MMWADIQHDDACPPVYEKNKCLGVADLHANRTLRCMVSRRGSAPGEYAYTFRYDVTATFTPSLISLKTSCGNSGFDSRTGNAEDEKYIFSPFYSCC